VASAHASGKPEHSATRDALLDAAEELLLEQGYASVTSRRVGARAGISAQLIHYYFDSMDELFVELYRRYADQALELESEQLPSDPQPLWRLWEWTRSGTVFEQEFLALANHREKVREEIVKYTKRFLRVRVDAISRAFERYGIDQERLPPVAVHIVLQAVSYSLGSQQVLGVDIGHRELNNAVEQLFRELEGERVVTDGAIAPEEHSRRNRRGSDQARGG
jgi:AcrR family transcriptional regulator